jgi:formate hydrogenlyase subunit 3/multisubunit Na+/H+ antiporter MnhD subunit
MNVFVVMDILAMIYIVAGVLIGLMVYFTPDPSPERTEEWSERINATPSTLNALASIVIGILWPYVVYKVLFDKKAQI